MGGGREDAVDGVVARARASQDRFRRLADEVAALRVTRGSAAGEVEVEVTVDGQGQLVDVRFGERVRSTEPSRLAAEFMRCLRLAQSALPDLVADLAISPDGTPDASDTVRAMVEGYRRRFPAVDPSARSPADPRARTVTSRDRPSATTGSAWPRDRPSATWLR